MEVHMNLAEDEGDGVEDHGGALALGGHSYPGAEGRPYGAQDASEYWQQASAQVSGTCLIAQGQPHQASIPHMSELCRVP